MPTQILVPEDLPSIEIRYTGVLSAEEVAESVREAVETARRTGRRRFLTDCTGLQGGHSLADLYQLAKEVQPAVATSGFREALLVPETGDDRNRERVLFWETTCRNRGLEVRTFTDRGLALEWLGTAP